MKRKFKAIPIAPRPLQDDRKIGALRESLDAEDRARKTVIHQDRDGQRISLTVGGGEDKIVPHRLGRKPRGVNAIILPTAPLIWFPPEQFKADTIMVSNGSLYDVDVTIWLY